MASPYILLIALLCVAAHAGYHCEKRQNEWNDNLPSHQAGYKPGKVPIGKEEMSGPDFHASLLELPEPLIDVFPPKNNPGDVIWKTDHSGVNSALDQVLKHLDIMSDRACAVGVANLGGERLSNPRWYLSSGLMKNSAPFEIKTKYSGLNLFHKKNWELRGSVGVLTYNIDGTDDKVAIMFSVPYDWNLYDVWFNIKVYPKSFETGEDMFNQMNYYAGPFRTYGWEERTERGVKLTATMTEDTKSKLYIAIDTSNYNALAPVEIHHDCDYHAGWVGNYCWRECDSTYGYCWVNKKCKYASDCRDQGALPCYSGCI